MVTSLVVEAAQRSLTEANSERHLLAEGPVWDSARGVVMWVDIQRGMVLTGKLQEHGLIHIEERVKFGTTVGAVSPSSKGEWIVAGKEELLIRDATGVVRPGPRVLQPGSGRRLNDGATDPVGRFVVGSMNLGVGETAEVLVRTESNGSVTVLDNNLSLSNGLAWSQDGRRMYNVDTLVRRIYQREYDAHSDHIGDRQLLLELDEGYPDGICLDSEGCLWVAVWGRGEVRRYSPEGTHIGLISVPAPHTSCVAFVGPDLDTLVITTATADLTPQQLDEYPQSGRIFTAKPGVTGAIQPLWTGFGKN